MWSISDLGLGPDVVSVVRPTKVLTVGLLSLRYSLYVPLRPYLCFISFLYIDLYLIGDNTSIN